MLAETVKQNDLTLKKGVVFMKMIHPDGTVEERKIQNVIVDVASILMAQLMKQSSGIDGVMTLAVGTGDPGWDLQNPPVATSVQTLLVNELIRKTFVSTEYIDGMGGVSIVPTNIVQYDTQFLSTEANGTLVEMGLFGGTGATGAGGGTMVNYLTFPVWNKLSGSTLQISWQLTF